MRSERAIEEEAAAAAAATRVRVLFIKSQIIKNVALIKIHPDEEETLPRIH